MRKLPELGHQRVILTFKRAGFLIVRQGRHIIMRRGNDFISIPRHNPIKRFTLEGIVKDSGLTLDEFIELI